MLEVLVILPNSRGIGYLRQALKEKSNGKALILPGMMGMDTFVSELTDDQIISPQEAILELFTSFRKIKNPNEHLSDFIPLGQVLLSDFEDIIRNGRNPEEVFGELKRWAATGSSFADFMDEDQIEALRRFSDHFQGILSSGTQRFVDHLHSHQHSHLISQLRCLPDNQRLHHPVNLQYNQAHSRRLNLQLNRRL